ncbi:MAG: GNAT family N-acetyltransferase, partial [Proteobacteria bacterium]|nr:GNAT family N-acetyltransferase [Pseudomonadota bacterium]
MEFCIRRARPEDAFAIIDSHVRSIREVCAKDYTPEQIQAWAGRDFKVERWHQTIERDLVWVVELEGRVRGFGHLSLHGEAAELMGLYFAPEARGRGAGKALFAEVRTAALSKGVKLLHLHATITAKSFYESLGFRPAPGPCFATIQGVQIACFPMSLELP